MNIGLFAVAILLFCITLSAYMFALYKSGDDDWLWFSVTVPILLSFGFTLMATYLLYLGGYV